MIPTNTGGSSYLVNRDTYLDMIVRPSDFTPPDFANSSLNSQSEVTITDDMTETHMVEAIELLVEIDRKIAQHGGRFGDRVTNKAKATVKYLSERLSMTSRDTIHTDEEFIPYGLIVDPKGNISFVLEVASEEDEEPGPLHHYVGLDLDQLDDCFPAIASDVHKLLIAADKQPTAFFRETTGRLQSKPALVALVHDYLKNGRLLIDGLKAEQVEQEQAGFYDKKNDFGTF